MRLVMKAKYTRRWKGKDGKWHYEYDKPKSKKSTTGAPPPEKDYSKYPEDLRASMIAFDKEQAKKSEILKELEGLEPQKVPKPWAAIKDKTWEQIGYEGTHLRIAKERYGPKVGKRGVLYRMVADAYKSINTSDYNLSGASGWTRMYVDEYKALRNAIPNMPVTFKEFLAIQNRMHKQNKIGMDVWDWTVDKIVMKWDRWEGKKKK